MRDRELPLAYARALYDLALESWLRDLSVLRDNLRLERSLRQTLEDENVPLDTKKTLIDYLLPPGSSRELHNFAYMLVSERRLPLLDDVVVEFRRLAQHGLNVVVAEVTTALPATDEEKAAFENRLTSRYGQNIDIVWRVDPAIIGGVVIRVGDEVIDDSVATRLETLRGSLKGRA